MTFEELTRSVAKEVNIPFYKAELALKTALGEIAQEVLDTQKPTHLPKFGTFYARQREPRSINTPNGAKTLGREVSLRFRPSKHARSKV